MDLKNLVGDAGKFITRAFQTAEEALYSGEKTNIDPQLESMCKQIEGTKNLTQRIVKDTETVLVPNPGYRVEDMILEKIEKKRPTRMSNMECLGQGMIEAGNEFGPGNAYGSMLIRVGHNNLKLGLAERDFINTAVNSFVDPLNKFLENEVKNAIREKKTLENKRLDLDAAKNRLRKARSMSSVPPKDGSDPRVLIQQAEREVITAQEEFTQQTDSVKIANELVIAARDRHVEFLKELIASQTTYFARCQQLMMDLNRELEIMPIHSVNLNQSFSIDSEDNLEPAGNPVKGKVMYDYSAKGLDEISVSANEILMVSESHDSEYFIANKGGQRGRVPKSCILIL